MPSKFAPIVKFKQEALDTAQRTLAKINFEIHAIEDRIKSHKEELLALRSPESGDFSLFNKHRLFTTKTRELITRTKNELAQKFHEQNRAQHHLNSVLQEFEKFKYLQLEEEKALKERLKKAEALFLDEVAIMGYNQKKGDR